MKTDELRTKANLGDSAAQDELGREIFFNMNNEADVEEAIMWFSKSAEQGYIPAYVDMARVYLMGILLDSNGELACTEINRLLQLADKEGNEEARFLIENEIFDWSVTNKNTPIYGLRGNNLSLMFGKQQFAVFYKKGSLRLMPANDPDIFICRQAIDHIRITKCGLFRKGTFSVFGKNQNLLFFGKYSKKLQLSMDCAIYILRCNKVRLVEV